MSDQIVEPVPAKEEITVLPVADPEIKEKEPEVSEPKKDSPAEVASEKKEDAIVEKQAEPEVAKEDASENSTKRKAAEVEPSAEPEVPEIVKKIRAAPVDAEGGKEVACGEE